MATARHTADSASEAPEADLSRGQALWLVSRVGVSVWVLWVVVCLTAITLVAVLFGMRPFVITSGSMEPLISRGDIVLTVDHPDELVLAPPTVITYLVEANGPDAQRDTTQAARQQVDGARVVTHRIVGTDTASGGYRTRGDANLTFDSSPVARDNVLGVGRLLVPRIGLVKVWANEGTALPVVLTGLALLLALFGARSPRTHRRGSRRSADPPGSGAAPSSASERRDGDGPGDGDAPHAAGTVLFTARPATGRSQLARTVTWAAVVGLSTLAALLIWVAVSSAAAFSATTFTNGSSFTAAEAATPPPAQTSSSWYLRNTFEGGDTDLQMDPMPIAPTSDPLPDVALPNYSQDHDDAPGRLLTETGATATAVWSTETLTEPVTFDGTAELHLDIQRFSPPPGTWAGVTATLVAVSDSGTDTTLGSDTQQTAASNPAGDGPNEALTFAIPTAGSLTPGSRIELRMTVTRRPVRLRYDTTTYPAQLTLPAAITTSVPGSADPAPDPDPAWEATSALWTFDDGSLDPEVDGADLVVSSITSSGPQVDPYGVMNNDDGTLVPDDYGYPDQPQLRFGPAGEFATSPADAVASDTSVQFTVTAPSDGQVAFDELTFEAARGGDSEPRGLVLRSSHDGYTTDLLNVEVDALRPTMVPYAVDLSDVPTIADGASVTFRLYVYTPGENQTIEVNDLQLDVDVASP